MFDFQPNDSYIFYVTCSIKLFEYFYNLKKGLPKKETHHCKAQYTVICSESRYIYTADSDSFERKIMFKSHVGSNL